MEVVSSNYMLRNQPGAGPTPSRLRSYGGPPSMPSNHPAHQSTGTTNSHFSTFSQSSTLRSSNSTAATSQDTLFQYAPPLPLQNGTPVNGMGGGGGPVLTNNNVLNKRADKDTSLFQICLNLRQRLRGIPECDEALEQEEEDARMHTEEADPVTLIWRTFRQGDPLMAIYNALNPEVRLKVDPNKRTKRDQAATFLFLNACIKQLNFPTADCFMINDLYGDDTTGFVKVTRVVNAVLDILVERGILAPDNDIAPLDTGNGTGTGKTQRQHIIDELVKTERTYVHHLELLQAFQKLVSEKSIISGDAIHDIFLNLNALLDFQRRFLIRVEQTNALPEEQQNWGNVFIVYKHGFEVYEPYIANTKKCEEMALREFDKLKEAGGSPELRQMVESATVLSSFLLKPFQRLAKYPLLLKELRDKGDLDEERKAEITEGIEVATAILQRANEAVHKEERNMAVNELRERVEDWKGHRLDSFGELLLFGTHHVIKGGASSGKEEEREYKIYLFQMILLCCKEMNGGKQKNQKKALIDKKGRPKLQLKGRIFMQNVTDTVCSSKPGNYTCQIFWKGDPGIEFFTIKFPAEDMMKKWYNAVDGQRRIWQNMARESSVARTAGVSSTEFQWTRDQATTMNNPYAEHEEDDDENADNNPYQNAEYGRDPYHSEFARSDHSIGRNDSSTSLAMRSRTNTGDSITPMGRVPPRQFPMGAQAPVLQVRTQHQQYPQQGAGSPNEAIMDSYFSPTSDSPVSTRSSGQLSSQHFGGSGQNGMFPFPRQQVPHSSGWGANHQHDNADNMRFTAPAMPRQPSRDGPLSGYQSRNLMQRPSLPPNPQATSMRSRSASTPDINNVIGGPSRQTQANPQQPGVPELPPFPAHYAYQPNQLGRAGNNNSPANMGGPNIMRSSTQSPGVQQQRMTSGAQARSIPLPVQDYQGMQYQGQQPQLSRSITMADRPMPNDLRSGTPGSIDARVMTPAPLNRSPPMPSASEGPREVPLPTQLKVRVHCPSAGSSFMLVAPTAISYQSLKDRIDAKLQRSTNLSLSSGGVRLKYSDDGDFVSILSDEDVLGAFESWREQEQRRVDRGSAGTSGGGMGEIELFVQ